MKVNDIGQESQGKNVSCHTILILPWLYSEEQWDQLKDLNSQLSLQLWWPRLYVSRCHWVGAGSRENFEASNHLEDTPVCHFFSSLFLSVSLDHETILRMKTKARMVEQKNRRCLQQHRLTIPVLNFLVSRLILSERTLLFKPLIWVFYVQPNQV